MRQKAGKGRLGSSRSKKPAVGKTRGTHNRVKDIIDHHIIKLSGKRRREVDGGGQ